MGQIQPKELRLFIGIVSLILFLRGMVDIIWLSNAHLTTGFGENGVLSRGILYVSISILVALSLVFFRKS